MTKEMEYLIELVYSAISGEQMPSKEDVPFDEINWEILKEMALAHNCSAVIFPAVKQQQELYHMIDEQMYSEWETQVINSAVEQCKKNYELKYIVEMFRKNNIYPALFKGAVLANLYPNYLLRVSGDADLLVDKEELALASGLLEKEGYILNVKASKENVPVYYKPGRLVIELHSSLWEDYYGERIDRLEKMKLTAKNKRYAFGGCDIVCDTLGYTEHFVYMIYHTIKHFIPGGIGIRHLIDITLYVNRYISKIDFVEFYERMDVLGYKKFCLSLFRNCIANFGMDNKILEGYSMEYTFTEQHLLEDVMDAGAFGNRTLERRKSRNIVKQTYYEGEKGQKSKFKMLMNTLFPSADALSDRYVNAKKYKILLPIAWIQRVFYHLAEKRKNKHEPSVMAKTKAVESRMKLLKELEL